MVKNSEKLLKFWGEKKPVAVANDDPIMDILNAMNGLKVGFLEPETIMVNPADYEKIMDDVGLNTRGEIATLFGLPIIVSNKVSGVRVVPIPIYTGEDLARDIGRLVNEE